MSIPTPLWRRFARYGLLALFFVVLAVVVAWCTAAIYFADTHPDERRPILAITFPLGIALSFAFLRNRRRTTLITTGAVLGVIGWWIWIPASHDREWPLEYARLPHAEIEGDLVKVYDVRNFSYGSTPSDVRPDYYDRTYDLRELTSSEFALSYWDGNTDIAHFMLTFGFRDEEYLAFSIETRREKGESWTTFDGFFKNYELILIAADERDLLRLRTNVRNEEVYLYPTVLTPEAGREIFSNIIGRMNDLYDQPQFYNTVSDNCMTSLLPSVGRHRKSQEFDQRLLLNGLSDQMAYENGMIDSSLSFEETRRRHHINQYVQDDPPDYSRRIRPHLRKNE